MSDQKNEAEASKNEEAPMDSEDSDIPELTPENPPPVYAPNTFRRLIICFFLGCH